MHTAWKKLLWGAKFALYENFSSFDCTKTIVFIRIVLHVMGTFLTIVVYDKLKTALVDDPTDLINTRILCPWSRSHMTKLPYSVFLLVRCSEDTHPSHFLKNSFEKTKGNHLGPPESSLWDHSTPFTSIYMVRLACVNECILNHCFRTRQLCACRWSSTAW
jgi:hypothetical protein